MDEKEKCCICGKEIEGMGNNSLSRENGRTVLPILQLYRGTARKNKTIKTRSL